MSSVQYNQHMNIISVFINSTVNLIWSRRRRCTVEALITVVLITWFVVGSWDWPSCLSQLLFAFSLYFPWFWSGGWEDENRWRLGSEIIPGWGEDHPTGKEMIPVLFPCHFGAVVYFDFRSVQQCVTTAKLISKFEALLSRIASVVNHFGQRHLHIFFQHRITFKMCILCNSPSVCLKWLVLCINLHSV